MVEIIEEKKGKDGRPIFVVKKSDLLEFMRQKKQEGFDHLSLITGVDRKDYMEVVYHLYSFSKNQYIVVKVTTDNLTVPSRISLWKSADWEEREQYDMLGIRFEGQPDLKRMFLPESWVGHPLRKDYDLNNVQYINMDEYGEDYATFDPGDGW